MVRLVILNRDGVINEGTDGCIKTEDDWQSLPGSLEAIARLTQAHYHIVLITNQSGIAQGLLDLDAMHRIHARMQRELTQHGGRIDAIYYCPHEADDGCNCRKPRAGLFRDLAKRLKQELTDVPAIGESLPDLLAAQTVKARPILVRTGKGRLTEQQLLEAADKQAKGLSGVEIFDDLAAAVDQLLSEMA